MAEAELGDDVLGEDPTVNALEERAAELLGKEAGLFVVSGTMGNLVSLIAHLPRGFEAIAGRQHHFGAAGAGEASGLQAHPRAAADDDDGLADEVLGHRGTGTGQAVGRRRRVMTRCCTRQPAGVFRSFTS